MAFKNNSCHSLLKPLCSSPLHFGTKSKLFLQTSKVLCGLSLSTSPSALHNMNPSSPAPSIDTFYPNIRGFLLKLSLESLFNALSPSKHSSVSVPGSDHAYCSSSLVEERKREGVSAHSTPTLFPHGEEHESPLFSPAKAEMMKTLITLRFRNLI